MSTLSCADIDGATLNLYSPLFRWQPAEGELYHESLMRRMRDILARTRDNPSTAYFGACWCCAHIKAFRISERDGVGVDKIYAANAAPEMATAKDIPCIDTSHAYEADLMDIFNPSTATATVAARLIGKGLKPNASVRYVKSQIVKHLQSIEAPEFVMFVLVAAVLGLYPSVHTRANVSAYIDIARRGTNAILDCIDPLSSREIFGLVCEFLVHCGARHPILKRLCEVPQTMDAVAFCDNTVRPKIHDKPVVRVRRKAPQQPAGRAIPALHDLWAEASLNRKVSSAVVAEVGGFEVAAKLYIDFMADSQILPRGMQFARPADPNPKKEAAMHKLMMHASREAHSFAMVPLCDQVRHEAIRFNPDPVWVSICTRCCAVRARCQGSSSKKQMSIEYNLRTEKPVCASCKQETVKHVDGRGMLFISYGRPIDRIRTACVCCTFCGVLCKSDFKHVIYPCCEHCNKERSQIPKKPKCWMCKERSSSSWKTYLPFLVQHHHRGRAVIEAGAGDECTPADAKAFIEEEWSKEGVSVMGVGNEHVQLMLPAIFADAGEFFVSLKNMGCLVDSEVTSDGHHVNVYTRNSLKPTRTNRGGFVVGFLATMLLIAVILLSYMSMKVMELSNTTMPNLGKIKFG